MKRTDWYQGDQFPAYEGLYERDYTLDNATPVVVMEHWQADIAFRTVYQQPGVWRRWLEPYKRLEYTEWIEMPGSWIISTQAALPWRGLTEKAT